MLPVCLLPAFGGCEGQCLALVPLLQSCLQFQL